MKEKHRSEFDNRAHMQSRDYELYYYSDRNLGTIRSHRHAYYEFCFFLEGDVSMEVSGECAHLQPGDVVMICPGRYHRAVIHDQALPYRRFVFWISSDYAQRLSGESQDYACLFSYLQEAEDPVLFHNDPVAFHSLESRILSALDEIYSNRFGRLSAFELQLRSLVLSLSRQVYEKEHPVSGAEETGLYQSLIEYIDAHLSEDLSLERLAERFFVSRFYLSHMFQEKTGISLHRYIVKKRTALSRTALLGGSSVTEAFETSGFGEYTSFYRAFLKEYGVSPGRYKEYYVSSRK